MLRLKHPTTGIDTGRALALTTDGNHRWCALDPRLGTALTVAEAVLNLACVGARPIAVVNCLNFGNPEHPEVMWQLSEAIDGLGDTCRALGLPVIGGNVSLYNESKGLDIDPTPVIGLLGVVDQLERRPPGVGLVDGHRLCLIGSATDGGTDRTLAGSAWAWSVRRTGGTLPALDLVAHTRVADLVRDLVREGQLSGAHDVASGGLGVALAEMAVQSGVGFQVDGVNSSTELLSEAPSRVVVSLPVDQVASVRDRARDADVGFVELGSGGGERLIVSGLIDLGLADATATWRDRLPDALGRGATQS